MKDTFFMNMAACIQKDFEDKFVKEIMRLKNQTGAEHLYYSGGASLNIPTNRILEQMGNFNSINIPPCPNDSGIALGAAAWIEYLDNGKLSIHGPFLNIFDTSQDTIPDSIIPQVSDLILGKKVIGICNGSGEIGPRALGHRSILALANSKSLRRHVSEVIKQREWYRPLAPIICEDAAKEVLEDIALKGKLADYMLGAYYVNKKWHKAFKGVIHENWLVRAQIVRKNSIDNSWMYRLLNYLWTEEGIPGIINTSFNIRGQPILHYSKDAIDIAKGMGLDGVVINGSLYFP